MQYSGGGDAQADEVAQACRAALEYAQQYNAAVQEARAQVEALTALQALVEVTFTQRY